jgi:uncharacterized membrane protein YgcG
MESVSVDRNDSNAIFLLSIARGVGCVLRCVRIGDGFRLALSGRAGGTHAQASISPAPLPGVLVACVMAGAMGLLVGLAVLGVSFYLGLSLPWLLLAGLFAAVASAVSVAGSSGWSSSTGRYRGIGSSGRGEGESSGGGASGHW